MAWMTYTPDGRQLDIEVAGGTWTATCDGVTGEATSAAEAIAAAIIDDTPAIGRNDFGLRVWIETQATRLETEAAL